VHIIGAKKGAGSVYQGIQYVQAQTISITSRSVNTLKAYRNYLFMIDKDGKILNDPDDTIHEWSNSMDAIRYGLESLKPTEPAKQPTTFGGIKPLYPELGIV
jgi:phage terminase large subunit